MVGSYSPPHLDPSSSPSQSDEYWRNIILNQLQWGEMFWKPLHDRMDYWMTMYLLLDPIQQSKPLGYRRFISNDPRTAIDSGVNILTRNETFWRIDMPPGINPEERQRISDIEKALAGIVDDIDELFLTRYEMRMWKQAAFMALARGCIWGKFHVTKEALDAGRPSPIVPEIYDGRWVYPIFDGLGMQSVVIAKLTTLAELMSSYPDQGRLIAGTPQQNNGTSAAARYDLTTPSVKLEYWSNDRPGGVKGMYACLGYMMAAGSSATMLAGSMPTGAVFLHAPKEHGFKPDALPVVGVPVNGIPLKSKPLLSASLLESITARASRLGMGPPSWHDPSGWTAEVGRSLLSSVEELVPQYNEMIATVLQHFSIGTYGTWVFKTQTGELPDFEDGVNAKIPLRIGEGVERFEPQPINRDAYEILNIVGRERERGLINHILQAADVDSSITGVAFQQRINAALNSLEPFSSGMADFGTMAMSHVLEQLKVAGLGKMSLAARSGRSYMRIEFDPETALQGRKYKPVPVFKPALPDDLLTRAQVARILLDPRRPVMSLVTVLDQVLRLDDPDGEIERIFEDIANLDPVIVLERVADALEKAGEQDIADRIRQNEFRAAFTQDLNFRQVMQASGAQEGAVPGLGPQSGSPLATGGGQVTQGVGGPAEPSPMAGMGDMGTRSSV